VAFRKERTVIGDKARDYIEKDPQNVVSCFKRKMGTDEKFFIPNRDEEVTPVELSALVLQELRRFIYTDETCSSVVITIPAAFDTVQSNATKQAGYRAGFSEVVLLQEPIAASLAFANRQKNEDLSAKWIVYDLGGGTFDAALISIDGEMKVIDHEGDNFFGGMDFDNLIVDKIIVPHLKAAGNFDGIERLRSASNRYNNLYYTLLHEAEELKVSLSNQDSADVEFEAEDGNGAELNFFFTVRRSEFEALILDHINRSIRIVQELLDRNSLAPQDVKEIILIGGSTYIPLVRRTLFSELGIPVNSSIDPVTAVVVGAAFYAASKTAESKEDAVQTVLNSESFHLNTGYAKYSQNMEEYFSAVVIPSPSSGKQYRIVRKDGGFDTGFCPLTEKIGLKLPLLPQTVNRFELTLYDRRQQRIPAHVPAIEIVQGQFSIQGQPLPNDICIEIDDVENKSTLLDVIFEKNSILPLQKTIVKTVSRTMSVTSDDRLLINVLEGSRYSSPQSCVPVGVIEIKAKALGMSLVKGCDVELCFEMNESRDLKITAYITGIDYEISRVFSPQTHTVHIPRVLEELEYLLKNCERYMREALRKELYDESAMLKKWEIEINELITKALFLADDDVTDEKYNIEKQKRKISIALDAFSSNRQLLELKEEYFELKSDVEVALQKDENELFQKRFQALILNEKAWLQGSAVIIRSKIRDLRSLHYDLKKSSFEWVLSIYFYYAFKSESEYSDVKKLEALKEQADNAIAQHNAAALITIVNYMSALLIKQDENKPDIFIHGTGLE
jgi:molecular chaperone DnaK